AGPSRRPSKTSSSPSTRWSRGVRRRPRASPRAAPTCAPGSGCSRRSRGGRAWRSGARRPRPESPSGGSGRPPPPRRRRLPVHQANQLLPVDGDRAAPGRAPDPRDLTGPAEPRTGSFRSTRPNGSSPLTWTAPRRAARRTNHPSPSGVGRYGRAMASPKSPAVEIDVACRPVRITSSDRVVFPEPGITKRELVEYYLAVGDGILRALYERPVTLERWPKGVREGMKRAT